MTAAPRHPNQPRWRLALAGPSIWFIYFMVVYLFVDGACHDGDAGFRLLGVNGVKFVAVGLTGVALAVSVAFLFRSHRLITVERTEPDPHHRDFDLIAWLLNVLFVAAVVIVGVPILVLAPC